MAIDRRALFRAIVGNGAAFGLALGGCKDDEAANQDGAAGTNGMGSGGTAGGGSGGMANGGSGGGGSGGRGGAAGQDAGRDAVVTDTFRGWAAPGPNCAA